MKFSATVGHTFLMNREQRMTQRNEAFYYEGTENLTWRPHETLQSSQSELVLLWQKETEAEGDSALQATGKSMPDLRPRMAALGPSFCLSSGKTS